MGALLSLSKVIDAITFRIGKSVGWLILAAVIVSAVNASVRFALNMSSNAWLELQWYLFGAVFLLGAGYTLQMNEHIRIDIVSSRLSKRARDWIEVIGHVFFLFPLCLVMIYTSLPFAIRAYTTGEYSSSAGGLILWPAKILVPIAFILLLAQGVSELIKRVAIMRGVIPDPHAGQSSHHPAIEVME